MGLVSLNMLENLWTSPIDGGFFTGTIQFIELRDFPARFHCQKVLAGRIIQWLIRNIYRKTLFFS